MDALSKVVELIDKEVNPIDFGAILDAIHDKSKSHRNYVIKGSECILLDSSDYVEDAAEKISELDNQVGEIQNAIQDLYNQHA